MPLVGSRMNCYAGSTCPDYNPGGLAQVRQIQIEASGIA
jgi:hypothetical protein